MIAERRSETPPRLLVIDDVADNRIILARRFASRGFQVVQAESGREGLAAIRDQAFDAVLLDIMMPGMDGLEVLAAIRESLSVTELPVIMVTAKTESAYLVEALRLQANDFITKPVIFDIALARVRAQVDRKRSDDRVQAALAALGVLNARLEDQAGRLTETNRRLADEISQRRISEDKYRFLTFHDPLTELPNRRRLHDELTSVLARQKADPSFAFALFVIDLDGFKSINDTLGHSVGDLILREIGQDFRRHLGSDNLTARLGGDEFAIVTLDPARTTDPTTLARELIALASRERSVQGHVIALGASIGIAPSCVSDDPEGLLKSADIAMYAAKAQGRGTCVVFDPAMDRHLKDRQELLRDLRGAAQRQELSLAYQPFICARTGAITGYEALIRWNHPTRGAISPAEFIPLAEETGLIGQIGAWVVEEACRQAKSWPAHQRVSVNVSPVQFRSPDLAHQILASLVRADLSSHRLEIEITEAMLIDDGDAALDILRQIKAMGIRLALDDFGTGYSSLSYLRRFPFDKVKVDRSFVKELGVRPDSDVIVKAICQMARGLDMTVTAEGVETEEQRDKLRAVGCEELQGYLFSKPRWASELPLKAIATARFRARPRAA